MTRAEALMAAASQVDVLDMAGRIIANPDRAMVSLAAKVALAIVVEKTWEVCLEADLLVRALAMPVTGDPNTDVVRDLAIQRQAGRVHELMTALRGPLSQEETTMAKAKAKAMTRVPQTREDAVYAVGRIGTLRRDITARKAAADEQIRIIGEKVEEALGPLADELKQHEEGLQAYCEAHRLALTAEGKVKFHDFGTGRVNWRLRPPKVGIRGVEAVIEGCKRLGLTRFLRVKEEINRDAMLADPDTARQIAGVSISSEGEDFVVEPVELDTAHSHG